MQKTKHQLTITDEDYETLNNYIKGEKSIRSFDRNNTTLLREELRKATLVKKSELPADVVRLNSRVKIKEGKKDKLIELILVLPEKANIKERKVSIFAPLATALIGFRQGEQIKWNVPAGQKIFTIMEVQHINE
jgi:regulator of nucleoside diphosphate kinase